MYLTDLTFFGHVLFLYLIGFNVAAVYIGYKAYSVFKRDYMLQRGDFGGGGFYR